MFVTRFGVSVEKVVATIETPTSHHGAARPDVKNSAVLLPARFAKKMAGRNDTTTETAMTVQSSGVRCIRAPPAPKASSFLRESFRPVEHERDRPDLLLVGTEIDEEALPVG